VLLEAALLAVDFLQGAAQDGGAEELAGVVEEMLKAPAVASSSSSVRTPAATLASSSSPASSGSAKTGPSGTFRASESSVPPTPSRVDGAGATPVFREATVRVPVTLLDGMVYRIDELVALKLRLDYERRQLEDTQLLLANTLARAAAVPAALSSEMEAVKRRLEVTRTDLAQEVHLLGLTAQALQEDVKDVRMLPVGPLLDPFRRMVRDLASSLSKEVVLEVLGEEVRIDKRILEMVRDPLMHLLRNAVDHGLETPAERVAAGKPARGTIVIQAENRESAIRLSVRDDGRGMDHRRLREVAVERGLIDNHRAEALTEREALNLVFMPSFSTSAQVTEISGRGVGLDVVRENIARLGGKVEFYSDPGRGTNFNLILPLTMATSSGLMVKTGTSVYAIPLLAMDEVVSVEPGEVGRPQGRLAISRRRQTISLVPLGDLLSGRALRAPEAHSFAVIVALSDRRVAVGVDQVLGQEEMVVKGVTSGTPRLKFVVGATSLADGKLVAVLDPGELMDAAMGTTISLPRAERRTGRATVLVAEDSLTSRTMIASVLEQAGYRALTAFDGQNALSQLRQTPVDLVVSDVEMPNLDGLGLIRALRGVPEHARTPAILLTSLGSVDARARGAQVGASAYLVKQEFDPAVFLTLVAELLEMAVDR
jgi:two-component system chemotaxis sensor kinase CheA